MLVVIVFLDRLILNLWLYFRARGAMMTSFFPAVYTIVKRTLSIG